MEGIGAAEITLAAIGVNVLGILLLARLFGGKPPPPCAKCGMDWTGVHAPPGVCGWCGARAPGVGK